MQEKPIEETKLGSFENSYIPENPRTPKPQRRRRGDVVTCWSGMAEMSETAVLGSFENSYIPENPRTPSISYISQTVIPFKKPTSGPSKTFKMITIR
ncbi:hypothetical protein LXL04_013306 [Taraxacum kok-saghyz]